MIWEANVGDKPHTVHVHTPHAMTYDRVRHENSILSWTTKYGQFPLHLVRTRAGVPGPGRCDRRGRVFRFVHMITKWVQPWASRRIVQDGGGPARLYCAVIGMWQQGIKPKTQVVLRLFYGCSYSCTCPAMTVGTVILRALDSI